MTGNALNLMQISDVDKKNYNNNNEFFYVPFLLRSIIASCKTKKVKK